jgi:hypothetical protein
MRSPITVTVSAAAVQASAWIYLDYIPIPFNVGLDVSADSGATGTPAVQYTPDNINDFKNAIQRAGLQVTRAGTVATVQTVAAHGLSVGDDLIAIQTGDANLDGEYTVASVPDANHLTYTVANTGAVKGSGNEHYAFNRVYTYGGMSALANGRQDGNLQLPCRAVRLAITAAGGGTWRLSVTQGHGRG